MRQFFYINISGGESALISSGGSLVGIGSDCGGSCRMPAHMAGCFGLKFTSSRVSNIGFKDILEGLIGGE